MAESTERLPVPAGVSILSDAPIRTSSRDFFGFRVYAEAIASLIDNELTDTPLTIAITAPWGGGKTSVAQMVQLRLEERTGLRGNDRPVIDCWFDAWMHNDAPHLGAALATTVARTANAARPAWRRLLSPVPTAMLRPEERWRRRASFGLLAVVAAALAVAVNPFRETLLSLPAVESTGATKAGPLVASALLALFVARSVFGVARDAASFVDDPRSEAARGSMAEVKQQLGQLIEQARKGGRFVIYVDDLERCAADRALEVCEVASQLLAHEGMVTILIADMQAIAAAAEARYPETDDASGATGRKFLEKIVQIQVALPPPHPEHMRRLLRGDAPDEVFADEAAMAGAPPPADAPAPPESLTVSVAQSVVHVGVPITKALVGVVPVFLSVYLLTGAPDVGWTSIAVLAVLVVVPLLAIGVAQLFLFRRARRARVQETIIRDIIRDAVTDQPTQAQLEHQVLDQVSPEYHALALDELESYRLDNSAELRGVAEVILRYPPELPRGAKRMLNHARLLTQIARDRHIFGGEPELTPQHLGEWIVLAERWPLLARKLAIQPGLIAELEDATDLDALVAVLEANGLDPSGIPSDLIDLLNRQPRLSEVIARLVHFEPWARSGDAEVLGVNRSA